MGSGSTKRIVVLDTSILLHYRLLPEIDWLEAVDAKEVEIVLTRTVISELNTHKDRRASRRESTRADTALKYLHKVWGEEMKAEIGENVWLRREPRSPVIAFADHGLNKDVPDDWVIASALELHMEYGDDVLIITNDIGQEGAARSLGIPVTWWGQNDYRLEDDADPVEKENARLKQQVQEYEDRIPKLELIFGDGGQHQAFVLSGMTVTCSPKTIPHGV